MSSGLSASTCPACPYLGIRHDSAIHYGFPVPGNLCFAGNSIVSIPLEYQASYCLGEVHAGCPDYQGAAARHTPTAAALAEITQTQVSIRRRVLSALLYCALGAGGVLVALVLLLPSAGAALGGSAYPAFSAAAIATVSPTPTSSPMPTPTPSPPPAATASPTIAPTMTAMASPTAAHTPQPTDAAPNSRLLSAANTGTLPIICTPGPIATPTPFLLVAVPALNLRQQTAADAPAIQVAYNGDRLAVTGRDKTGKWVQTCCLGGWPGWVLVQHVNLSVPVMLLPVVSETRPPPTVTSVP
jgi:hypothetical protein